MSFTPENSSIVSHTSNSIGNSYYPILSLMSNVRLPIWDRIIFSFFETAERLWLFFSFHFSLIIVVFVKLITKLGSHLWLGNDFSMQFMCVFSLRTKKCRKFKWIFHLSEVRLINLPLYLNQIIAFKGIQHINSSRTNDLIAFRFNDSWMKNTIHF